MSPQSNPIVRQYKKYLIMALRNRNSVSSCGVYQPSDPSLPRRHCSSVASLEHESQTGSRPLRQKSQILKEVQLSSPTLQYPEIQNRYLRPVYDNLNAVKSSSSQEFISGQLLTEWRKMIKTGIFKLRELFKECGENSQKKEIEQQKIRMRIKQADEEMAKVRQQCEKEINELQEKIRSLIARHQEDMQQRQTQFSHQVLEMSTEFGKREQNYRQVISKCIHAMNNVQRKAKPEARDRQKGSARIRKSVQVLQKYLMVEERNKSVYEALSTFIEQMYDLEESQILGEAQVQAQAQAQHKIGDDSKENRPLLNPTQENRAYLQGAPLNVQKIKILRSNSPMYEQKSLGSLGEEGIIQIANHNSIDMSSIAIEESEGFEESLNIESGQCRPVAKNQSIMEFSFQNCLSRLICSNFFSPGNRSMVIRLMNILKELESPDLILHEPIYPIIVEACKLGSQERQDSAGQGCDESGSGKRVHDIGQFKEECPEAGEDRKKKAGSREHSLSKLSSGGQSHMLGLEGQQENRLPKSATFKI